jgi:N-acetyl-anhydromuramyl-L-alanine amidase AmpD
VGQIIYPKAVWRPLADHSEPGNLADKRQIIPHITEGPTAAGAIETFRTSQRPHRTSAHAVIDRDGTIYQLVDFQDIAWHASQVNHHAIGIEHVALSAPGAANLNRKTGTTRYEAMPATEAQYAASARLIAWLAKLLQLPIDRKHIRTHWEASPADGHELCCTGALDPDRLTELAVLTVTL